ncbi:hypothetical protein [Caulobacter vibrioides]|uniref:hypothetical protein n=1 Tax=Caulobacter vibrioides TaxID=155892 RepID=UPI000F743FA7|nr:hypothetical protein [Caulobacter vibrioides]
MSIDRMHKLRASPNFRLHELPEEERDDAGSIRANIAEMHRRSTSFWSGRNLFQRCAEQSVFDYANQRTYHEWQLCAARDCVMSIYHFGRIIEGIDISISKCPQLREIIDGKSKREARKRFERYFPSYITLRHAIAHSAERSNTLKDASRHGRLSSRKIELNPDVSVLVGSEASMLLVHDNIYGTTFSSMWDGALVRCEINDQSGVWLDEITDAYWASFDKIIDPNPEPPPRITVSSQPPADF